MPFPVVRESDESGSDFEGIEEQVQSTGPQSQRKTAEFKRLSPESYLEHQDAIKSGLRGNVLQILPRFPLKGTLEAERFPSSSDQKVFTLDGYDASSSFDNVDFIFPVEEFPAGFIDMKDKSGRRWKCVAYWNGECVQYIVNVAAEIRLCGNLFAGSTKGGKVRWDKAVVPNNLIPGKFDKFAVSDKVLLERRKSAWPAQLKQHQEDCNINVVENQAPESKKKKRETVIPDVPKLDAASSETQPAPKKRKFPSLSLKKTPVTKPVEEEVKPVSRKLDFDLESDNEAMPELKKVEPDTTYIEIKAARLCTRISSDDEIKVEMVSTKNGNTTRTTLFCN